jgi:Secretion system C-terminal sorting domain/PKD domain
VYGSEPIKSRSPITMKKALHFFTLAALFLISAVAYAQPAPPYTIYINGQMQICSPVGSTINVQIIPSNGDPVNYTFNVDPNCNFNDSIEINDATGAVIITYPCNGALQTISSSFTVDFLGVQYISVILPCSSSNVDCMGVTGGSALPGTPCDDSDPNTINDTWSADCNCAGVPNTIVDCLGVVGGSALPGTPCDDGDPMTSNETWNANCTCIDSSAIFVDCLGVAGGSALPGTACDDNDPNTTNDAWDANCNCVGQPIGPGVCSANFWVVQGYTFGPGNDPGTVDTTVVNPIPNELWAWNLSTSSTGNMTFLWSFGDGTSSTEAYPSHVYDGTGPYTLCLTIADASGCTDTYCQTISVDADGLIVGVVGDNQNDNRSVITLNVVEEQPLSVASTQLHNDLTMWPNPVQDAINLSITSGMNGQAIMSVTDMNGKVVAQTKNTLRSGKTQLQMNVSDLKPGMYMLQISNGTQTTTRRFVKQ